MKNKLIVCFLFFAVCQSSYAAVENIIVFGDSLSDAGNPIEQTSSIKDKGNNYWVKVEGKEGAPISNQDFATGLHYLWINYLIAKQFPGQTIYPVSQLANKNAYYNNLNYAWASAESGNHYINDLIMTKPYKPYNDMNCVAPGLLSTNNACVPGVRYQIQMYLNDVNYHPNPNTIFIIWAGGNDVFNNIGKLTSIADPAKFITNVIATFSQNENKSMIEFSYPIYNLLAVKNDLIKAGVKPEKIYFINLPDLSKTPAGRKFIKNNPVLKTALQFIIKTFNLNLKIALSYNIFSNNNIPPSNIFSVYDLLENVLKNPAKFGFSNVEDSCVENKSIPYCTGYLFFNDKHPTLKWGEMLGASLHERINEIK